jgi:hypothetical protein
VLSGLLGVVVGKAVERRRIDTQIRRSRAQVALLRISIIIREQQWRRR